MLKRRLVSIPVTFGVAACALALAPLLLPLAWLASHRAGLKALHRAAAFLLCMLALEVAGIVRLTWNALRPGTPADRQQRYYRTQCWWASGLLTSGTYLFDLRFEVTGVDAIAGPSAILLARHASIGDNVLPLLYFSVPRQEILRYVLKKELTWLPTLDLGGHNLPNLFVDRSGDNTAKELDAVGRLVREAPADQSVMIYPEGTRYTAAKHTRLAARPELTEQLARWPDLLPPRLGGVTRMLADNPGKDVVCMCHTGFEGASSLGELCNGSWVGQTIRMHFWRVPFGSIPADHGAFVFTQWDRMQACILAHRAA